jgi:iron complex outermembrane receptor protein
MHRSGTSLALATLLAATTALAQGAAPAQPAAPAGQAPQGLEEITVTATRRGAVDLQTTPVAVSAISDEQLELVSPENLGDIAGMVPNFSAGKPAGFNAAAFAMRGVGQTSIIVYADANVGVTVDDFVIPHIQTQLLDMFDIEQIEALRGPQGTLFGKNTTGGVVNVRTKQPVLGELGFELQERIASFGRNETRFAVNAPVYGETLAFRAAGAYVKSDGYYENGAEFGPLTNVPPFYLGMSGAGNGKNVGGDDSFSGRFKLLWQPSETFHATLTYELLRDNGDSPPTVNTTDRDSPETWNALGLTKDGGTQRKHAAVTNRHGLLLKMDEGHRIDVNGGYLNAEWILGDFTIDSVTGFRDQKSRLPSTYTGEVGPNSLFDATRDDDRETWQQELRVSSSFEGPINFVGGFFYQHDETTFCVLQVLGFLDLFGLVPLDPTFFNNNPQVLCNEQTAKNWALFADATYEITDRLTVGGGFRWTNEDKDWRGRNQVAIQDLPPGPFDPTFTWRELGHPLAAADFKRFPEGVVSDSHSWGEPSGRATISYEFSDALFAYFTYAHGFKSGAYNDQTGTSGQPIVPAFEKPTDPETADSYELGLKTELLDNRLRLDLAGFYVQYDDAQRDLVAIFDNPAPQPDFEETRFFNAAKLNVGGIELEAAALVSDYLDLRANFGWIHADYKSFHADTDFNPSTPDADFSDRPVNRAPEFQAGAGATLHHGLFSGQMTYDLNVDYEDESIFVYSAVAEKFDGVSDNRTLLNASIGYTDGEDLWFVRVYGHNLTDEEYRVGELPVAALWTFASYGEPRTFGVEFGFKFAVD